LYNMHQVLIGRHICMYYISIYSHQRSPRLFNQPLPPNSLSRNTTFRRYSLKHIGLPMPSHHYELDWSSIDEKGKKKVITQLADFYIELQKHEFDRMGCLDQIGTKRVGPLARECLTDFRDSSREMQLLGLFEHIQDYYKACIGLLLDLIHREEVYVDRPVDVFLMYTFLYNLIPQIYPSNPQGEDEEETTTLGLFKGLRKSLGVDGEFGWEEWKEMALERYADDHRLRDILHRSGG